MGTTIRLLACAAVLAVPARGLSQADPPTLAVKGHVLLLQNERIFEGDIEKVGDHYSISRPGGGQTFLPCAKALRLCASREDAYQYLRTQANLDDADERLRLARWCLTYELQPQALTELKAADELRPGHAETRRLLASQARSAQLATAPPSSLPPAPVPFAPAESKTPPFPAGLALNTQCMGLFARRVQPILMNTCARCHASGKAGEFKLTQVFGDAPISGKSSQQNLTAVLSQIKPEQPSNSPLLRMAASAHGGSDQPPLRNRDTPAYKALEQWVQLAAVQAPKAVGTPVSDAPASPSERPVKNAFENVEPKPAKELTAAKKEAPTKSKDEFAADEPEKTTGPADEFDPIIFNRQMHPEKK